MQYKVAGSVQKCRSGLSTCHKESRKYKCYLKKVIDFVQHEYTSSKCFWLGFLTFRYCVGEPIYDLPANPEVDNGGMGGTYPPDDLVSFAF